jgi:hypothetical protein
MLTVLQKSSCEAIYRAHKERGINLMDAPLASYTDAEQRRRIEQYVLISTRENLAGITMGEIATHGALRGGYTGRWPVGDRLPTMPQPEALSRDVDTLSRRV